MSAFAITRAAAMVMGISTTAFAEENDEDPILLNSYIYIPSSSDITNFSMIPQPLGPIYTPGTIKIDDVLQPTSAIMNVDSQTVVGDAIYSTFINVLPFIPEVGTPTAMMFDLFDLMKSYFSIFDTADFSRDTTITTRYSYRLFSHIIKAYTEQSNWKEVGSSVSKYYYKHIYARVYCDEVGDYVTRTKDFTHSNGFEPAEIAEAPNYMNYEVLSQYGSEAYETGKTYRETY